MPSALSVFYANTSLFGELEAQVDVGEKLNIYDTFKGKKVFSQKTGKFLDFSGLLLLLGSLSALFYGYQSLRNKEYLRSLASLYGHRTVFVCIWLSRVFFLIVYFLGVSVLMFLTLTLYEITFSKPEILHLVVFAGLTVSILVFFFSLGMVAVSIKGKIKILVLFSVWFGLVYLLPVIFNEVVEIKADKMLSNYSAEYSKLKELMDFEKDVTKRRDEIVLDKTLSDNEKRNKIENMQNERMAYYSNVISKKIQGIDQDMRNRMQMNTSFMHGISFLFPSTCYMEINNEVSSRGFQGTIAFYDYVKKVKEEFFKFYQPRKLKELRELKEGAKGVESLFEVRKDLSNVFQGKSELPWNYGFGIMATVIWCAGISLFSYRRYKKFLFSTPKDKIDGLDELEIGLDNGISNVVVSKTTHIRDHLYSYFSGKNQTFPGKISMNGSPVEPRKKRLNFLYICRPDNIPSVIKVKDYISFLSRSLNLSKENTAFFMDKIPSKEDFNKRFEKLSKEDKARIFFNAARLKKCDVVLIDDYAMGMPVDFIQYLIRQLVLLKAEGVSILYFTNDVFLAGKIGSFIVSLKKDAQLFSIKI